MAGNSDLTILELIRQDHGKVINVLGELKATGIKTVGLRDAPYIALRRDLLRHMYAEEKVFYPAIDPADRERVLEALEEHNVVRFLIEGLDNMLKDDLRWSARLKVLSENVRHHVREEEGPVFLVAEKAFGRDKLVQMGREFERAKEAAPRFD